MSRKIEQTRRYNLELLIAAADSVVQLARRAGTHSAYLSQVRHGTPSTHGKPRAIGDHLAGKLEQGMDLPDGWLDEPHPVEWAQIGMRGPETEDMGETRDTVFARRPYPARQCPVISWVQAGEWTEVTESHVSGWDREAIPCPVRCSEEAYVLRVRGISMEPDFRDGDLIFVDPRVEPTHGKFVVVMLEDSQEATFKQLLVEDGRQYLKALNPEWPTPIIEVKLPARFCGVVIFKGTVV